MASIRRLAHFRFLSNSNPGCAFETVLLQLRAALGLYEVSRPIETVFKQANKVTSSTGLQSSESDDD